jgi:hypothetical protein
MIEVIEGKGVGSGKSYFVIDRLLPFWIAGGTAYVSESFQVVWDECKAYAAKYHGVILEDDQFREVSAEKIMRVHEHTAGGTEECPVVIVIDEAQDQFGVREGRDKGKNDVFTWACQSRHDDNDLLFVTQNVNNIDVRIRRIATFIWSVRNSKFHSTPGIGNTQRMIQLCTLGLNTGHYFIRTQLDYDGRTVMQKIWRKVDKRLFRCYRSKAMANKRTRGGERIAKKQLATIKGRNNKMVKWILLGGIAIVVYSGWSLISGGGIFGNTKVMEATPSGTPPPVAAKETAATERVSNTKRDEYELVAEKWLGRGEGWLRTESGEYRQGEMSRHGFVQGIRNGTARIQKPDGKLLYIVGMDYAVPLGPPPPPTPTPRAEIIVVADTPRAALAGGATWKSQQ